MLTLSLAAGEHGTRLQLHGALRIDSAADAKAGLIDAVATHAELEFDLSTLTGIDAAGLQLLLLAKREAGTRGHRLRLVGHSPAVVELFELYQLAGQFGDPIVLPAPSTGRRT